MLGITRINHTAFRIDEKAEQLQQFYTETLGVPSVPRDLPEELQQVIPGFWLQLDATQVHFIQAPAAEQPRNPLAAHLAFYVESLVDAVAELKRLEIVYDQYDQLVFFSDPAGKIQRDRLSLNTPIPVLIQTVGDAKCRTTRSSFVRDPFTPEVAARVMLERQIRKHHLPLRQLLISKQDHRR